MSRWSDPDSAVSSFCIFLAASPQLDKHYTVFGRVIPDTATLATLDQITKSWTNSHAWIVGAKEIQRPVSDKSASAL
jgi:cyclophilin family peptidyl-prolyl cis-trans isomerase